MGAIFYELDSLETTPSCAAFLSDIHGVGVFTMTHAGRPRKRVLPGSTAATENGVVVRSPLGRPECPAAVAADPVALKTWEWLLASLEQMGILAMADRLVLEMLAIDYAELQAALLIASREGMILVGEKGGSYSHPAFNIANSARKRIHSALSDLGLTPRARDQLNLQLAEIRKSALATWRDESLKKVGAAKK